MNITRIELYDTKTGTYNYVPDDKTLAERFVMQSATAHNRLDAERQDLENRLFKINQKLNKLAAGIRCATAHHKLGTIAVNGGIFNTTTFQTVPFTAVDEAISDRFSIPADESAPLKNAA